jgi:hypothetical protein
MDNLRKKIEIALSDIDLVTDYLYKQEVSLGYQKLNSFISIITEVINLVFAYKSQQNDFKFDENKLIGNLTEAMNAMENKDTILLADILEYEIKEQFHDTLKQL